MMTKAFGAWIFPVLSLAIGLVGIGLMLWIGEGAIPFLDVLSGPPHVNSNSFPVYAIPALLAGLLGFWRAKPKEIWSYGLLMWIPQATAGVAMAMSRGWFSRFGFVIVLCSLLAAIVGVLTSYAGFALRIVVNRIRTVSKEPPSIF